MRNQMQMITASLKLLTTLLEATDFAQSSGSERNTLILLELRRQVTALFFLITYYILSFSFFKSFFVLLLSSLPQCNSRSHYILCILIHT
jgi:hypothetical protein